MGLEGQPAPRPSAKAAELPESDERGYILVALLIGIAVAAVWMGAALPSWRQQNQREKEEELIFRGEQYARALMLYRDKMNGALPSSIDDLISQHVLRHKWKDPITNDEFVPVAGCGAAGPAVPPIIPPNGSPPPRGQQPPPTPRGQQPPPTPRGQQPPLTPGPGRGNTGLPGQGGICGVQSKSEAASIKAYNGQSQYNLWQFTEQTARIKFQQNLAKLSGGAAAPGQGMGIPTGATGGRGVPPGGVQPGGGGNRGGQGGFPGGQGGFPGGQGGQFPPGGRGGGGGGMSIGPPGGGGRGRF